MSSTLFIVNLSIGDILVIGFAMPFRVSNVADAFYIFLSNEAN